MKRRRPRRRSPLPFLLLAVVVVGCAFAAAVAAVVPMEAERDKLDAPAAFLRICTKRRLCGAS